jgi:rhamnopyranosyl-N-acetylglucosaminyl-diphospho-decaprenol beta-1,3/1,4-galactofuranosyltransferase
MANKGHLARLQQGVEAWKQGRKASLDITPDLRRADLKGPSIGDGVDGAMLATVVAVVLTYNRKALLKDCVQAMARQTRAPDAIVVMNNGSTDGTDAMLATEFPQVTEVCLPENVGPAGGYHAVMQYAHASSYTWVWMTDDDGQPAPETLAHLLDGVTTWNLDLASPLVLDVAAPDQLAFPLKLDGCWSVDAERARREPVIHGQALLFNGTLMRRRLIAEIGLPQPRFYHQGFEVEYGFRLLRHQVKQAVIPQALFYHPEGRGYLVLPARWFRGRGRVGYTQSEARNFFQYRNAAYINRYVKDWRASMISLVASVVLSALFFLVIRRGDIRGYILCLRAMWDGLRGTFEDPKQILARYP